MKFDITELRGKRAFLLTLDAFLAAAILISGIILLSSYSSKEAPRESIESITPDLLNCLSELKMSDLEVSKLSYYSAQSNYTNYNYTIIEQIATYWAANQTLIAQNLTEYMISGFLENNTGIEISLGDDSLYMKNGGSQGTLYTSDRMITGVLQGAPLTGSTSSAYLRKITDKRTSSFVYFGGFVGQGNITVFIDIPSDVSSQDINKMIFEGDVGDNLTVWVNAAYCTNVTVSTANMTPDYAELTKCNSSIIPGRNNISVTFTGTNNAYIAGGYIRIDYKTDELNANLAIENKTYEFPEIRGIVNLYDSFYIPGNLTNMKIYLHYIANHSVSSFNNTFYLTIGNKTVFLDQDSTTVQSITFDNSDLEPILNYTSLSGKTVPIRLGFENLTYEAQLAGNSEVVLITDTSGSMEWKMIGSDWDNGVRRNCNDSNLNLSTTTRLSVAKCLGKEFAAEVTNVTGNKIGVVSYSDTTNSAATVSPTTNPTPSIQKIGNATPQTGYAANGGTCICCGINSAKTELTIGAARTVFINASSSWKYSTNGFNGTPANDAQGDAWFETDFYDSSWASGNAILGYSSSGGISTSLGFANSTSTVLYANLWERTGDTAGPPNDFTSGIINSTANTFGLSGQNDGWDWAGGASAYGFDNDVDFNSATGGHLNMDFKTGSPAENRCSNDDCSGAYGITVNITSEMASYIANGGTALLSFYYEWDGNDNPFSTTDEAWIKGKFISQNGSEYWLGSNLDSSHTGSDSSPEIASVDNPDQEFSGNVLTDISAMIYLQGMYYLHLGGKLRADDDDEWGNVYFDNIQIRMTNRSDSNYYFRKHFNITSLSNVSRAFVNILADDTVKVYVNGNLIFSSNENTTGNYWDAGGISFDANYLTIGDNVVAVELMSYDNHSKFDLELIGVNKSESGAFLLMTDGQANSECAEQNSTGDLDGDGSSDTSSDDAIQASCDAREEWGLQGFAVGISSSADEPTLSGIADCGGGIYAKSDNVTALSDFYNRVVLTIISETVESQTIIVSGGLPAASNIYSDSYITYEFTPVVEEPKSNEIGVEVQTSQFNSCSPTVTIPSGIRVADAKITSYSGEHWTKQLRVNSNEVFNLSQYSSQFIYLGDPYIIQIPPSLLVAGSNSLFIDTGDETLNSTGCSMNNTLIYTALVPSTTSRSDVVEKTEGCTWNIQFEDDTTNQKKIPLSYAGAKNCSYMQSNHTLSQGAYDPSDAYDIAVYNVLKALDFDNNGKVFVNLDAEDIEIVITTISSVPYLWGPSTVVAKVWQ